MTQQPDMSTPPPDTSAPGGGGSLGRAAAAGTLWLVAQKWAMRVSGIVTIAILTRLVSPEEFGVVAIASAIIPFVLMLSELGLSTYIVQVADADQRRLSTAFWFSAGSALLLGSGLVAVAPALARLVEMPAAAPVLQGLAASIVIVVLGSVPTALMRRALAFRTLAVQATASAFVAQAVAVVLALRGAGVWALVLQLLVSQLLATLLVWWSARWRPSLQFSWPQLREIARFGASVVSVEVLGTGRVFAENAIIAVALGPVQLGYLNIAQRLVQVVQDLGATAVLPVSTAVFAKIRDTLPRLRTAYLRSSGLAFSVVTPLLGIIVIGAPELVPLLFGPEWTSAYPVAQGLAVAAVLTLGAGIDQGLFDGMGRPGAFLVYAIPIELLTVGVTALAAQRGIAAVAWGFAGVAATAVVVRWIMISRFLEAPPTTVARPLVSALLPASASVAIGWLAMTVTGGPALASLAVATLVTGSAHVLLIRLMSPHVFTDVIRLVPLPRAARAMLVRVSPRDA